MNNFVDLEKYDNDNCGHDHPQLSDPEIDNISVITKTNVVLDCVLRSTKCLSEFATESQKKAARNNLGIDDYINNQIENKLGSLDFPDNPTSTSVVEILSPEQYEDKINKGEIITNAIYLLIKNGEPVSLYIGQIQIAKKEELGNIGFPYKFPIIF